MARAETNVCTTISALPATLTTPGVYCLQSDLAITAGVGKEMAINIPAASDITLDCNGFRISGTVPTTANEATLEHTGVYIGSSSRVTVRNCRLTGFHYGIQVGRNGAGQPRSRDIVIEDNTLDNGGVGVQAFPEGTSRISGNLIANFLERGFDVNAPAGQTTVSGNLVSRTGTATTIVGQAGLFSSSLGGWLIVDGNVFAETVGPSGSGNSVVRLAPAGGIGVAFTGNTILAPANATQKGSVTVSIGNPIATLCQGNTIVGYALTLPPNCTDPSNKAY
jgi:hypothetical protein